MSESEIDPFYDPARDLPDVGNRFELLGRLGEGGMGEVFKARDVELDEIVALKILTPQFGEDQSRLDRLKQEVKLARKISSPGVCRIHDLVELPNGIRGIAMEFIEGQTLGALVDQGLEVDYTLVCWDADLRQENGEWASHQVRGAGWSKSNAMLEFRKNTYRVLLTRARKGMVIFVPKGDESGEDETRDVEFYDGIYNHLIACGATDMNQLK